MQHETGCRRHQPTVKFRDVKKDLLERVKAPEVIASSDDEGSSDEEPGFMDAPSTPRGPAAGPGPSSQRSASVNPILPKSPLNLSAPALLDLLADMPQAPLRVVPQASSPDTADDDRLIDW